MTTSQSSSAYWSLSLRAAMSSWVIPRRFRLAAELSHRIREHLGVRVVDFCRLHRLARSDDLVAGRENGDDRLPPDFDGSDADRGQDAGITAGQELTAAQHGLAAGDIRSGETTRRFPVWWLWRSATGGR